jgi:carboxymethylenebutenolidase
VLAALDRLADPLPPEAGIGTIGFSFGAHWAAWSAAQRERVGATVLYYGTTDGPFLAGSTAPLLGHFAEQDPFEDAEWVETFAARLRAAGRETTIHVYPGTGHWFAEPSRDAYVRDAADLAFERTVVFLRARLGG